MTRQRKWQLKRHEQGLCQRCGLRPREWSAHLDRRLTVCYECGEQRRVYDASRYPR